MTPPFAILGIAGSLSCAQRRTWPTGAQKRHRLGVASAGHESAALQAHGDHGGVAGHLRHRAPSSPCASFVFTETYVLSAPQVLVFQAASRFDAHGQLTDEGTRKRVRQLVEGLVAWTRRLNPV
jgi:hypothetical protein